MERRRPGNLSIKPIFSVVANANCVNQVVIRIQFCVSFPQAILPKPAHYKSSQIMLLTMITSSRAFRLYWNNFEELVYFYILGY